MNWEYLENRYFPLILKSHLGAILNSKSCTQICPYGNICLIRDGLISRNHNRLKI